MFAPIHDVPAVVAKDRQHAFLLMLPKLEARAKTAFANVRCPHDRADAVAEVVAVAWEQFRRLPAAHTVSTDDFAAEIVADVRTHWCNNPVPRRRVRA